MEAPEPKRQRNVRTENENQHDENNYEETIKTPEPIRPHRQNAKVDLSK